MARVNRDVVSVPVANDSHLNRRHKKSRPVASFLCRNGAGNETRTRDPNLGKVVLYQLSYSRVGVP